MEKKLLKLIIFYNTLKPIFDFYSFIDDLWSYTHTICNFICIVLNVLVGINLPVDQLTIIVFSLLLVFLYWKNYFPFYYSSATLMDKYQLSSFQDKYR